MTLEDCCAFTCIGYLSTTTSHKDKINDYAVGYSFFTAIVKQSHYDEETLANPKYMRRIPIYHCSEIEAKVRGEEFKNNRSLYDGIEERIATHLSTATNCDVSGDKNKAFDAFVEAQHSLSFINAFKEEELNWAYNCYQEAYETEPELIESDLTAWERLKESIKDAFRMAFGKKRRCYLNEQDLIDDMVACFSREYDEWVEHSTVPRAVYSYEALYENILPGVLGKAMVRDYLSQYYMIKNNDTGQVYLTRGSSAGSGTRETHGYYGHLFAEWEKAGRKITSFIISIDEKCQVTTKEVDHLVLMNMDLTGNYQIDRNESKTVLDGIDLFDYNQSNL